MIRRQTKNKERILALFQNEHLLTLGELEKKLRDVDSSTLYRNLKRFVEDGVLREVHLSEKQTHWELADDHAHFVCDVCDDIAMVDIPKDHVISQIPSGSRISHIDLTMRGVCKSCAKK